MSNNSNTDANHPHFMKGKDNIIVGLDIGTTKVCAIVGQLTANGKINVLGMGKAPSQGGVSRGMVANISKAEIAIRKAVDDARRQSQIDIKHVFVGIAGHHIKSMQHRGTLSRKNADEEIAQEELDKLEKEMENLALSPGQEILHVVPQEYRIDEEEGVKDPVGRLGVRVECNYHIVTGHAQAARHIYMAVRRAGLEVVDLIVEPFASAAAVLSEAEMEAGVVLVDIGGGTTDVCIFEGGAVRHTAIIDIGGDRITRDLQDAFGILQEQAEIVKVHYGSCYPMDAQRNEVVVVPGLPNRRPKEISLYGISQVIQARMEDIIERVDYEIQVSGLANKLGGGIVVTGGGSSLKNIIQLFTYHTGMDVNIGMPNQHLGKGMIDEVRNPMYATGIGLVLKGFEVSNRFDIGANIPIYKEPETVKIVKDDSTKVLVEVEVEEEKPKEPGKGILDKFSGGFGLFKGFKTWIADGEDDFSDLK